MLTIAFLLLKRLVLPLVILGALFVGGNSVAERVAEGGLATAAKTAFGLPAAPTVDIRGFPVIVKLLQGTLPDVSLSASDVPVQGLVLRDVSAGMKDIKAEDGFLGGTPAVVIGSGHLRAEADDAAINAFLKERKENATIAFREGGRATVRTTRTFAGARRRIVATGKTTFRKGVLTFTPTRVTVDGEKPNALMEAEAKRRARLSVELPTLPGGVAITRFETQNGFVVLTASLENFEVKP